MVGFDTDILTIVGDDVFELIAKIVSAWDEGDEEKIERVRVPMLFIHGETDMIIPIDQARVRMTMAAAPGPLEGFCIVLIFFQNQKP